MTNFITAHDLFSTVSSGQVKTKEQLTDLCEFADPNEDHSKTIKYLIAEDIIADARAWQKAMQHWVKVRRVTDVLGAYPKTAADLVPLCALKWQVDIKINGSVTREGNEYFASSFIRDVRILCRQPDTSFDFQKLEIDDAASLYKEQVIADRRRNLIETVMYSRNAEEAAAEDWSAIEACFESPEVGFVAAVFKKFMHQVKNKLLGRDILDHLMPILTGPQGSGKSTFIEMITAPLADVTANTDFGGLADRANIDIWGNYIVCLPEMQKAEKADIAFIKAAITERYFSTRKLYTNESDRVKRCTTFIGDANVSVDMLLNDPTGMRRFVDLLFKPLADYTQLRARFNKIDFLRLWQSVNPSGEDPMKPFITVLKQRQEESRNLHPVEEWLAQRDRDDYRVPHRFINDEGRPVERPHPVWRGGEFKKAIDLYHDNFKPWCEKKNKNFVTTDVTFYKQLRMIHRDYAEKYGLEMKVRDNVVSWRWFFN